MSQQQSNPCSGANTPPEWVQSEAASPASTLRVLIKSLVMDKMEIKWPEILKCSLVACTVLIVLMYIFPQCVVTVLLLLVFIVLIVVRALFSRFSQDIANISKKRINPGALDHILKLHHQHMKQKHQQQQQEQQKQQQSPIQTSTPTVPEPQNVNFN